MTASAKPAAPAIYTAIIDALECRRRDLGLPQDRLGEFIGIADRSWPKYLRPEATWGRQATLATIQVIVDVLYPDGFRIEIVPVDGPALSALLREFADRYPSSAARIRSGDDAA